MLAINDDRDGEVQELGRLGLGELASATEGIAAVHSAISRTVFRALGVIFGRRSVPARILHDDIAGSAYRCAAEILRVGAEAADHIPDGARPPSQTAPGAAVIGVLHGLIGDALHDAGSALAAPMSIRVDGVPVAPTPGRLSVTYPQATDHVVVFLHGLMETEHMWRRGGGPGYGNRLADDIGTSSVQVRYNTGRHVSDNGRDLAALLSDLVLCWPVPVRRLSLVGHSMGGLVIRSACGLATDQELVWRTALAETVSLGTPHLGAPLARGVHLSTALLGKASVTAPIGDLLRRRSAGIRDLFHGATRVEDWAEGDRDAVRQPGFIDPPLVAGPRHLFVTASVTRRPDTPIGRIMGDGLVRSTSGRGRNRFRDLGYRQTDGLHIGSAHHFTLLNDDRVYSWLRDQLRPLAAIEAASTTSRRG